MPIFLFIFIVVPLIELALLIQVGQGIGVWNTIAIVILTGTLGAYLARSQGLSVWLRIQQELAAGKMPSDTLFDGVLFLICVIVLLTPGLLTDAAGFFLLIPQGRKLLKNWIRKKVEEQHQQGKTIHITKFKIDD